MLFAYGASKDRRLGIPGEDRLKGIYSARAFVGWYNGLPEYADLAPDLSEGEEAVIVGQGNVALDVARTLLTGVDRLKSTDITGQALDTLSKSRVKRVRVVGRRGPLQASFTIKEIRELMTLQNVWFEPIDTSLLTPDPTKLPRSQKRLAQLLMKGSQTPISKSSKSWALNFMLSPISFDSLEASTDQLSSITFAKTKLQETDCSDPAAKVTITTDQVSLPASLAFKSIGYKSQAMLDMDSLGIPFDERLGIIPNDPHGRVLSSSLGPGDLTAAHIPGIYCAGWVKRGPTGVIATTMEDAFSTAEVIASDWENKAMFLNTAEGNRVERGGWNALKDSIKSRGLCTVSWADWQKIDAAERDRGAKNGKEREKFTTVKEMLEVLD